MEKHRKQAVIISTIGVVMILLGTTFAFFNYTRTGVSNTVRVGRISFESDQTNTITLLDVFPIDSADVSTSSHVGTGTITIEGDTTYDDGVEYQLTVSNLTNTVNSKEIPIDVVVTANGIGDSEDDYFTERGGDDSIYKVLTSGTISNNKKLLVGYIPKGQEGVDGTVTIKAYIDKEKIAISDTYLNETFTNKYNPNMTSAEITSCVEYFTDLGAGSNLLEGETLESFCQGTGTFGGLNIQICIDNGLFPDYIINDLIDRRVVIIESSGTSVDWVNNRTVFTTEEWNSLQSNGFSFQVKVEANEGIWVNEPGDLQLKKSILAKEEDTNVQCSNITLEKDGITYLSGSNDCVDMNYVWYSGKLWRIVTLYSDGSMKLMTEDMITSINWGSSIEYNGSWIYQWLNEDFYDTLENPNNIIKSDSTWNYSMNTSMPPLKPESLPQQKTISAPVGLLNLYEYYNSAYYAGYSNGYLYNGYYWWLITPYSNNYVYNVGNGINSNDYKSYAAGVRPSIIIKPGLEFTGSGTITSPYKIVGDKEKAVNNTTLLSSRSVGEYVNFDNNLYRIVDTSNGITKLTSVNNLKDSGNNNLYKYFASSGYYGKEGNTESNDYWDYYLNNTWYNNISTTYKNMLIDGTYYLGLYSNNTNYKSTICKDDVLDSVTTKNCTKYTVDDEDKIFTGKVGLPRAGEMFSSQIGKITSSTNYIFTVTPVSNWSIRSISINGYLYSLSPGNSYSVRPSITLKPGIKIIGGTGYVGGETDSPFEISE